MLIDSIVAYAQGVTDSTPLAVIVTMLAIGLILCVCSYIADIAKQKAADQIDYKLSKRFLDIIHKSDFLHAQQEEYKNKCRMAERVMSNAGFWMIDSFATSFTFIITIIAYASLIDLRVTWVTVLAGFFILIPYTITNMRLVREQDLLYDVLSGKERLVEMYKNLLTSTYPAKEIRLFGLFDYLLCKWTDGYTSNQSKHKKWSIKSQNVQFFFDILMLVLICLLFLYTFRIAPLSSPGQFTVLLIAFTTIIHIFKMLGDNVGFFYATIITIDHLEEFESLAVSVQDPEELTETQSDYIIELKNVYFSYNTEYDVLKDISFNIKKDEVVAIVGGNGSGKTTLAMLLVGLYNPREGNLQINGKHPNFLAPDCDIVMVAQNYGYYNALSLIENIDFGRQDSTLTEGISRVDDSGRLTNNLDKPIGNAFEGIELSGGEWQRIALLRPLATNAGIVIFDEPTASLDPISELKVFQQFMSLYKNRTRIIISHRLGAIKNADKIIVMDEGRIIGIDSHKNLLQSNTKYSEMYEAQASWYKEGGIVNE